MYMHRTPIANTTSKSTESDSDQDNISIPSPEDRNSLCIGTLNANSIKGKRAELAELLYTTQLDVLIISETKLPSAAEQKASKKTFNPSEVLLKNYNGSIHRPRTLGGGGVMIATKEGLTAEEVPLTAGRDGEIVCAKITLTKSKSQPLYICAYFRPLTIAFRL